MGKERDRVCVRGGGRETQSGSFHKHQSFANHRDHLTFLFAPDFFSSSSARSSCAICSAAKCLSMEPVATTSRSLAQMASLSKILTMQLSRFLGESFLLERT
eukprot:767689-Hanusia_phi.AAC.8